MDLWNLFFLKPWFEIEINYSKKKFRMFVPRTGVAMLLSAFNETVAFLYQALIWNVKQFEHNLELCWKYCLKLYFRSRNAVLCYNCCGNVRRSLESTDWARKEKRWAQIEFLERCQELSMERIWEGEGQVWRSGRAGISACITQGQHGLRSGRNFHE